MPASLYLFAACRLLRDAAVDAAIAALIPQPAMAGAPRSAPTHLHAQLLQQRGLLQPGQSSQLVAVQVQDSEVWAAQSQAMHAAEQLPAEVQLHCTARRARPRQASSPARNLRRHRLRHAGMCRAAGASMVADSLLHGSPCCGIHARRIARLPFWRADATAAAGCGVGGCGGCQVLAGTRFSWHGQGCAELAPMLGHGLQAHSQPVSCAGATLICTTPRRAAFVAGLTLPVLPTAHQAQASKMPRAPRITQLHTCQGTACGQA